MKAFLSFPVALLFVLTIASIALAYQTISLRSESSSTEIIALEKKHYADATLKKAFLQVFSLSPGSGEKESSEKIAENLARLQAFAENHFSGEGIEVELWFGEISEAEEESMLERTLALKKPVRCFHCYSFKTTTVDWGKKPVFKSMEFVFGRRISKSGFAHTPSSAEWIGKEIAFGATFYAPAPAGVAWMVLMKEGFG